METHLRMRPAAAAAAKAAEALGGALLEGIEPEPVATAPLAVGRARAAAAVNQHWAEARAAVQLACAGGGPLAWRRRWLGMQDHALPIPGASLLRIPGGRAMPRHGHDGEELTLVLHGAFEDESGRYQVGDLVLASAAVEHRPRAAPHSDCVCLVAMDGGHRFTGALGGLAWACGTLRGRPSS